MSTPHRSRARPNVVVVVAACAALLLAGCGAGSPTTGTDRPVRAGGTLSIGTGNTTGVYFILGGAYAQLVQRKLPGYRVTPTVTGAGKENIDRLVAGKDAMVLSTLSWAADAAQGKGAYGSPQPVRAIARLYPNYVHVVVRSDIGDLAGLRGRRISTGSPGSAGELAADRLLALVGLDVDTDTRRSKKSLNESVQAMKEGRLDALFWEGGLPTSGIQDLTRTAGARVKLLDLGRYVAKLRTGYPQTYESAIIGAEVYGGKRVTTVSEPNLLVVNSSMPAALADDLAQVLFSSLPELSRAHPEGRNVTRATAPLTAPVPLHAGARTYYASNP